VSRFRPTLCRREEDIKKKKKIIHVHAGQGSGEEEKRGRNTSMRHVGQKEKKRGERRKGPLP